MNEQGVLFDLDGTLTDSFEGIAKSAQYALRRCGVDEPDLNRFRSFIGPPLIDSFQEFYGFSEALARQAVCYYRERFSETGIYENKVYHGVPEMLQQLKNRGISLCIASSKPRPFVERILEYFKLDHCFDFVSASELDGTRVDKAEVIAYALQNNPCRHVFMVGDRKHDAKGALQNAVDFIGVTYGFGGQEELLMYPHVYLADSPADVARYILENTAG